MAETQSLSPSSALRFGVFQLNLAARELRKHGVRIRLPGQPFCILSMLLEKPGKIVTREEMRQRLWPSDTFVDFEHSLNSAIKKLRATLNDSSENSRYIETVPRLGYRFIAPVEEILPAEKSDSTTSASMAGAERAADLSVVRRRSWMTLLGVSAILITVAAGTVVWSRLRNRTQGLSKTSGVMDATSKGRESSASSMQPAPSPKSDEVQALYHKGLYFWNKRTVPGFQQAIEYFQQATALDGNYAPAYAGLANSYSLLSAYSSSSATLYMPRAREAALRALQLDNGLAEAHAALALIVQNQDWDWQTAEREYTRAIALNPNYATAHQWYAEHLMWLGHFDEALAESDRASQLDPLSLIIAADRGAILYYSRQYDRAIKQFLAVLQKDPNFVRAIVLNFAYVEKNMFAEAIAKTEIVRQLYGEGPWYWSHRAYIYGRAGQLEKARRELEKLENLNRHEPVDPATFIWAHLGVGDEEEALADLEKAYSLHFAILTTLKVDPGLDPLRGDPRFHDLLRRVGLADIGAGGETKGSKPFKR